MKGEMIFEIEDRAFQRALERYALESKKEFGEVVKAQARLLCVNLAIVTQPFRGTGNFNDRGIYTGASDRALGEGAIRRDLFGGGLQTQKHNRGIFFATTSKTIDGSTHFSTGNIRMFFDDAGNIVGTDRSFWFPNASVSQMRQHHRHYYRNGRMTQAGSYTRDIGRWKFIDQMVIGEKAEARYLAMIQKRVGFAKGGWASAARSIGGTRGMPQWVTRHKDQGRADDHTKAADPHVILHNDVSYCSKVCPPAQRTRALNYQRGKMLSHLAKRERSAARRTMTTVAQVT